MKNFLNVQESAKFTEKSEITIRRLIDKLQKEGALKSGFLKRKKAARGYNYSISKEILIKHFKIDKSELNNDYSESNQKEKLNNQPPLFDQSNNNILSILKKELESKENQLKTKDEQLKEKDKHISKLLDRQQESNILMKGQQNKIALLEGGEDKQRLREIKIDKSELNNDYSKNNQKEKLNNQEGSEDKKNWFTRLFS